MNNNINNTNINNNSRNSNNVNNDMSFIDETNNIKMKVKFNKRNHDLNIKHSRLRKPLQNDKLLKNYFEFNKKQSSGDDLTVYKIINTSTSSSTTTNNYNINNNNINNNSTSLHDDITIVEEEEQEKENDFITINNTNKIIKNNKMNRFGCRKPKIDKIVTTEKLQVSKMNEKSNNNIINNNNININNVHCNENSELDNEQDALFNSRVNYNSNSNNNLNNERALQHLNNLNISYPVYNHQYNNQILFNHSRFTTTPPPIISNNSDNNSSDNSLANNSKEEEEFDDCQSFLSSISFLYDYHK